MRAQTQNQNKAELCTEEYHRCHALQLPFQDVTFHLIIHGLHEECITTAGKYNLSKYNFELHFFYFASYCFIVCTERIRSSILQVTKNHEIPAA